MLHKHHRTVALLGADPHLKYLIRDYFALPKQMALMPALLARRLGQADLVLCLLRLRDAHFNVRARAETHIEKLIGHAITYGPGCLLHYRDNGPPHARLDRTPRITFVVPVNPRRENTDAYLRWSEYKLGRSTAQLRSRGVKPKDIRKARKLGWIKLEEVA